MEKSSIHEKDTVQSEPETQKGPDRAVISTRLGATPIRGLTPPLG